MISLKEVVENITTIIENDMPEIITVTYQSPELINTSLDKDFPKINIYWDADGKVMQLVNQLPLHIAILDVARGNKNESLIDLEVKSDCLQYASKLLDLMQVQELDYFNGDLNENITPLSKDYNDGSSGVMMSPNITLWKPAFNV